jgi:hypothetical protein
MLPLTMAIEKPTNRRVTIAWTENAISDMPKRAMKSRFAGSDGR